MTDYEHPAPDPLQPGPPEADPLDGIVEEAAAYSRPESYAEAPDLPTVGEMQDLIDEMILSVESAKSVPLSSNVVVDRDQMLEMLHILRDRLPEEIRAARWMVREREMFVSRTNEQARGLVAKARNKANELVAESNIIAEATEEANILVRRAEDDAHRIRLQAEDYLGDRLERLEALLSRLLNQTRTMRAELYQALPPEDQHGGR